MGYKWSSFGERAPLIWLFTPRKETKGEYLEGLFLRYETPAPKRTPDGKEMVRYLYLFKLLSTNVPSASYKTDSGYTDCKPMPGEEYGILVQHQALNAKLTKVRQDPGKYAGVPFRIEHNGMKQGKEARYHDYSVECDESFIGTGDQGAGAGDDDDRPAFDE